MAVGVPEPVLDFTTKQPRIDRTTGHTLYAINIVVLGGEGGAEVLSVKFPSAQVPTGITVGAPVLLEGLTLTPYSIGDKSGISLRCERVVPAVTPTTSKASTTA
jgi:hypothetical protein